MNMKKRLTRGNGVEERIISGRETHQLFQTEAGLNIHFIAHQHVFFLTASSPTCHEVVSSSRLLRIYPRVALSSLISLLSAVLTTFYRASLG